MTMKICNICKDLKEEKEFYLKRVDKPYLTSMCKSCHKIYSKKYQEVRKTKPDFRESQNKSRNKWLEKPGVKEHVYELKKLSAQKNIITVMLRNARKRAHKYNLEFSITKEDIQVPLICPILNIPLEFGNKKCCGNSPSLDRITPSKGYIKGNTAVISMLANTMKNSASKEQLETFCKNILKYIENDDIVRSPME